MENPSFTGPPKFLQDLSFFNIRILIEWLPTAFFFTGQEDQHNKGFIGPPLFSPVEDRGPVDFPMSVFMSDNPKLVRTTQHINWVVRWATQDFSFSRSTARKLSCCFQSRGVVLTMIACCSITQTLTVQSKVWWWHARNMVVIYFKQT